MDDRVDELSEEDELDANDVAVAHREIASSTMAAIAVAVNRPPDRDESEGEDEGAIDTGLGDLDGGWPRKMSASSLSSTGGSSKD
jgi:hypothetical protein